MAMLRTTIFLLSYVIRRFIADQTHRLITWIKTFKHFISMHYAKLGNGLNFFWNAASSYRYLYASDPHRLTLYQRLQRLALIIFLTLPDYYYRFFYAFFGRVVAGLPQEKNAYSRSKLLLIIGTLGPGGAERQAILTLSGYACRGYKSLRLVCISLRQEWERFFLPYLDATGIPVSELERHSLYDNEPGYNRLNPIERCLPPSLCDVTDFIRTLCIHRPKVVHLWLDECNIKGGLAAVVTRVPRIVLGLRSLPPCNFNLHQPYMREGYRWLVKQPGVVLLNNSVAGARAYEKWLGLPEKTIHVVHNGFDFDTDRLVRYQANRSSYRTHHNIPEAAPLIGTVIRFSEEKRPLLWLEIAAAVRQQLPKARFLMVGDGPLRVEMEARIASDDLRDAVSLVGYQKEVFTAIAAMDIFLLTSRLEGLPNVLLEAQALGVPVVTTQAGGASETVLHGRTGWVLEHDDYQHAAKIILKLLHDQSWQSQARNEAPHFVHKAFGLKKMLDESIEIYGMNFFNEDNHENCEDRKTF